jgi:hypothetical protein
MSILRRNVGLESSTKIGSSFWDPRPFAIWNKSCGLDIYVLSPAWPLNCHALRGDVHEKFSQTSSICSYVAAVAPV